MKLFLIIRTGEQLEMAARKLNNVNIILPAELAEPEMLKAALACGGGVYVSLPEIIRENKSKEIEEQLKGIISTGLSQGLLIKSIDEAGLVKELNYTGQIIADSTMYAYNSVAARFLRDRMQHLLFVLPDELSDEELKALWNRSEDKPCLIYCIYGRQLLMVTAQDTGGMRAETERVGTDKFHRALPDAAYLANSRGDRFICVWNEKQEYTEIFNAAPTSMFDKADELNWDNYLIRLSTESGRELEEVLDAAAAFAKGNAARIPGAVHGYHYKGIE